MPHQEPAEEIRDRVLDAAEALFYRCGVRAVGMDHIRDEARVSLKALYAQFASKDALVAAYLHRRDQRWRAWLEEAMEAAGPDPVNRLLAVFDALGSWFADPGFHGCAFINVYGETPDAQAPAARLAIDHKDAVQQVIAATVRSLRTGGAEELIEQLMILVEGAIVRAHLSRRPQAAHYARTAAATLLERHRSMVSESEIRVH